MSQLNSNPTPRALRRRHERGAALIAVLLLTMVLSAIGLVAMHSTINSMHLSSNFRLRRQAQETSSASANAVAIRAGDDPGAYFSRHKAQCEQNRRAGAGFGALSNQQLQEGACGLVIDEEDFRAGLAGADAGWGGGGATIGLGGNSGTTGLFNITGVSSSEDNPSSGQSGFQVVMRDVVEGPPPAGSGAGTFCTKKVYFGSRSTIQRFEQNAGQHAASNWDRPAQAGSAVVGLEAWLGPVPCRGGGSN